MASCPIASWQIRWENMALETYFFFLGSRITADIDGTNEITRQLPLGRKSMTNLDSVLKTRDVTMLIKVHIVKAMDIQWSCKVVRGGP